MELLNGGKLLLEMVNLEIARIEGEATGHEDGCNELHMYPVHISIGSWEWLWGSIGFACMCPCLHL